MRHGETEWSLTGKHTGQTDIPLTTHGKSQARALTPRLRDIPFAAVISSPLQRAVETCQLSGLLLTETVPDVDEWNYGQYEGLTSDTIRDTRPGWGVFRDGCPGGESVDQVQQRADRVLSRLRRYPGNVAVFSHGQFGEALAARWIGRPVLEAQHFHLDPATVSIFQIDPAHPAVPVISLWNSSGTLPGKKDAL
ncbi:histidine phosphatase family protein [Subtercola boreus]|uniref:Histidine phosphatase family protein n=1 Tax=Subtercola boreus TaxID=120213 RepID=A0A3E0VBK1_9MICO|nr:histidine phosphatase family protein [Subtercola boreus]